ncbi:MAG TPA: PGPGW domain-containing protein [Actinomycetota bacterium]|nr:PGPGW domain-containing protein [Actinomycetota bacterium]
MKPDDTQQFDASHTREMPRVTAVRHTRRVLVLALGGVLLAGGLALMVLPGPGIPLIFLGLTVLSWEFPAAKRLLFNLKMKVKNMRDSRSRNRR